MGVHRAASVVYAPEAVGSACLGRWPSAPRSKPIRLQSAFLQPALLTTSAPSVRASACLYKVELVAAARHVSGDEGEVRSWCCRLSEGVCRKERREPCGDACDSRYIRDARMILFPLLCVHCLVHLAREVIPTKVALARKRHRAK